MSYTKIKYKEFELEYKVIGAGPKKMLGFHGFSRDAEDYEIFSDALSAHYTMYSFNLFHHGDTIYPENRIEKNTIQMDEIKDIFQAIITELKIEKVAIMGYSMGGKFALAFTQFFPEKTERLILLAPDGIFLNKSYYVVSHMWVGRKLFKSLNKNPKAFFRITKFLKWTRLLPPKGYAFVIRNMKTSAQRKQVFDTWLSLKDIYPDNTLIQANLISHSIKTDFIYGKYDSVFPPRIGERYLQKVPHGILHIVESGHEIINPQTQEYIKINSLFSDSTNID